MSGSTGFPPRSSRPTCSVNCAYTIRSRPLNKEQAIAACQAANVRLIRFLYCDNGCTIAASSCPSTASPGASTQDKG